MTGRLDNSRCSRRATALTAIKKDFVTCCQIVSCQKHTIYKDFPLRGTH